MKDTALLEWGYQPSQSSRPDGRDHDLQIRPPTVTVGVLKNANGSARFQMGLTSVLAGIFGPKESTSFGRGTFDKGFLQVAVRPIAGNKTLAERYAEGALTSVLSSVVDLGQLIRSTISIVIQPEEDDGGLLSCSINAAMCALLDAGIPCKSTYLSIPLICRLPGSTSSSSYALDPTTEEITSSKSHLDQSTYVSFTLDIHSGSLVQSTPEYFLALQQDSIVAPTLDSYTPAASQSSWAKYWSSTVDMLDASSACCKVLAEVVRQAFKLRFSDAILTTITANNEMKL